MIVEITLAIFLILFSNLTTYRALKLSNAVSNLKDYFSYDESSLVYVNIVMFVLSAALIAIGEVVK